jgi:hypothetical protein
MQMMEDERLARAASTPAARDEVAATTVAPCDRAPMVSWNS